MRQKTKMDPLKKFIYVLRLNSGQGHLTSYAAELTFYILLAIIPLLLVYQCSGITTNQSSRSVSDT